MNMTGAPILSSSLSALGGPSDLLSHLSGGKCTLSSELPALWSSR